MNKKQALYILPEIIESAKSDTHRQNLIIIPELEEFSKEELMDMEFKTIGVYLTDDPLEAYRHKIEMLTPIEELDDKSGQEVNVGGRVIMYRELVTKKGQSMAFLTLEDFTSSIEVVIFPYLFKRFKDILGDNKIIEVKGKVQSSSYFIGDEEIFTNKIIVDRIFKIQEIKQVKRLNVILDNCPNLEEVRDTIIQNSGIIPVDISYDNKFLMTTELSISNQGLPILEDLVELERIYE